MAILINLAPDSYQVNLRDKQRRTLAISLASLIVAVSLGGLAALLIIVQAQKLQLRNLQAKINDSQAQVAGTTNLVDAVTLQKNLSALPGLYAGRTYTSQFFPVLIAALPKGVSLSNIGITSDNTVTFSATAKTYSLAAKFVKALQASNTTTGAPDSSKQPFFTNVDFASVGPDTGTVEFSVKAQMSPEVTRGR